MSQTTALRKTASEHETVVPGMGRPLKVPLSKIRPDPGQPRKTFIKESIEELAEHLLENGQQEPCKVRPDPERKGCYILIGGERRWRAFNIIQAATGHEPTVDIFIETVAEKQQFKKAFLHNLGREDLPPLDTAAGLHKLHVEDGDSKESLSKLIGKSYQYVDNYIKLHTLPDEVKRLMDPNRSKEQQLSITTAIDIARSTPDKALRIEIAREALERRLGVEDARKLIEMRTGAAGWRVGGFQRDSNADYKQYSGFLGRTQKDGETYLKLDFEGMYFNRDNEYGDREDDADTIRTIIGTFQNLLKKVEEKK